jgi:hypothetical protein
MTTGSVGFSIVHLNDVAGNGLPQEGVSSRSISCNRIRFSLL